MSTELIRYKNVRLFPPRIRCYNVILKSRFRFYFVRYDRCSRCVFVQTAINLIFVCVCVKRRVHWAKRSAENVFKMYYFAVQLLEKTDRLVTYKRIRDMSEICDDRHIIYA